jgi:hypothetical protein
MEDQKNFLHVVTETEGVTGIGDYPGLCKLCKTPISGKLAVHAFLRVCLDCHTEGLEDGRPHVSDPWG